MKYNEKELVEMTPENWDGKSREMLVWSDLADPIVGKVSYIKTVVGYNTIKSAWIVNLDGLNYEDWPHCAEIPTEEEIEKDSELDVALKRELMEHAKSLNEVCKLKEENEKLKDENAELNLVLERRTDFYEKLNKTLESTYLDQEKELVELRKEIKQLKEKITPEKKFRRMTYKELDEWLKQGKGVVRIGDKVSNTFSYDGDNRNHDVSGYYKICGYDEDTWHYPMIEV